MTHFAGLPDDVVGIILVGAEGCGESAGETWLRDATPEELKMFQDDCLRLFSKNNPNSKFNFGKFSVDGNNRPYWPKAVLDRPETPPSARVRAEQFVRVTRLTVEDN